jgi:hypothetical protein
MSASNMLPSPGFATRSKLSSSIEASYIKLAEEPREVALGLAWNPSGTATTNDRRKESMPASVRLAGEEFKTQKELNHRFFAIASYYAPCHWDTNSVSGEEDLTFLHAAMLYHPDIDFDPYQDSFRVDFNSHMSLSIYVDGGNINYGKLTGHIFREQRNGMVVREVPVDYFSRAWDALAAKSSKDVDSEVRTSSDDDPQETLEALEQLAQRGKDVKFFQTDTSPPDQRKKEWEARYYPDSIKLFGKSELIKKTIEDIEKHTGLKPDDDF